MTSKLSRSSTPDDFVVTGSPPVSATASRRPRAEALQRAWLSWLSIQARKAEGRTDLEKQKLFSLKSITGIYNQLLFVTVHIHFDSH